jgi:hypothetical protein
LFLTFFFLGREIFFQEQVEETETAKGLSILLDPFSYLGAVTEASSDEISFRESQVLGFDCSEQGLGNSIITINQKTSSNVPDKYIFGKEMTTKKIHVLSKPFKMPFRVADLIFVVPDEKEYCFVKAPYNIEQELEALGLEFEFHNSPEACAQGAIKVCFDVSSYCEIKVYDRSGYTYDYGEVRVGSERVYFVGSLLYGAIFSSKEVYDCNVKRLMARMDSLISIYKDKARYLDTLGCSENYYPYLSSLDNTALNFSPSLASCQGLYESAQELENINDWASCPLY